MNLRSALPYIEVVAGAFAVYFGVLWFRDPHGAYEPGFGLSAFVFVATEAARRYLPISRVRKSKIDEFIQEGQRLLETVNSGTLPIADFNSWVDRMNNYFENANASLLKTRLNDFSGLTFYGDGSEHAQYIRSIGGRIRRLMEFASEIGRNGST